MSPRRYCLGPRWVAQKLGELQSLGLKIGKAKRFGVLGPLIQSSLLQMAENIGNLIGFQNVVVEPILPTGDADIKFVDEDVHYLQVKSPFFLRSKYGCRFAGICEEFNKILSKSKSRFAVGYATDLSLIPIEVKDVHKGGRKASLGILAYDTSFVPTQSIVLKIMELLNEADTQLGRIRQRG